VRITGLEALAGDSGSGGLGLLAEILLGGLGALVVMALVFGTPLAAVPLVVAAISILATFLVLRGLAVVFELSFVVQFLVGLIGLGVAIDYSLLLVVRWREEHDRRADPAEAVRRALATAGHAIVISGTTVAIGLLALVAVPVPFIRSIGVGGLLIPLMSVLVTLTLLPGLLATAGARLDRRRAGRETEAGAGWGRAGRPASRAAAGRRPSPAWR
jgi:RND superfamily putative drug exporter